jgi:DNA repair protein RadA/Sms
MGRARSIFRCGVCGGEAPRWTGRCAGCGAWNSLAEETVAASVPSVEGRLGLVAVDPVRRIAEVDDRDAASWPTGIDELDRVLCGGLVPGSVTLLGGEPGIGKSTLLLQLAARAAGEGQRVLYVTGEESASQVRRRAARLGALPPELWLAATNALPHVIAHVADVAPDLAVVDSIQTLFTPELTSAPGSVGQVRECAHRLVAEAKARNVAVVLVGHVTKDGALAGPRVLEHVVDTVLTFEGDRHHALRLLRAMKHRFGSTNELGLFEMTDTGLAGVPDASGLFLADRQPGVAGSVVVPTIDGYRPLLVEVQALVADAVPGTPRRSAQGIDPGRLAFLLAVLQEHGTGGERLQKSDVYALAAGGVRVSEPGADLGIVLALASSLTSTPLPADLVACGEVGLGGELRQVGQLPRRLAEAGRLGFQRAVLPPSAPDPPRGIRPVRVATVGEALRATGLLAPTGPRADGRKGRHEPDEREETAA